MGGVIEVVLPVFLLIGLGFVAARRKLMPQAGFDGLSSFVFALAAPSLIFVGGSQPHAGAGGAATVQLSMAIAVFLGAVLLGRVWFSLKLTEAALFALACVFGNSLMMGVPIIVSAYGAPGVPPMLGILALQSMVLLALTTVLAEIGMAAHAPWKRVARTTALGVVRNPVVMAVILAMLVSSAGIAIPGPLRRTLELLGQAAPGVSLFCLGGGLAAISGAAAWRETATICSVKLLVLPGLVWGLGWLVGLSPIDLAVAVTMAALPTGANAFIFARRYTLGMDRSGAAVVITTALSIFTLSALIGHFRGMMP